MEITESVLNRRIEVLTAKLNESQANVLDLRLQVEEAEKTSAVFAGAVNESQVWLAHLMELDPREEPTLVRDDPTRKEGEYKALAWRNIPTPTLEDWAKSAEEPYRRKAEIELQVRLDLSKSKDDEK